METKRAISLAVGDQIPVFTLVDQSGTPFNVQDHLGRKLIIYFYPKDETPTCTKEACAFRDSYKDFESKGAMVIGINSGSVASHRKFAAHHNLNFTLLSDPGNLVLKSFGIKNVLFLTGRETFVVDEAGRVVFKYRGFLNGNAHVDKTLAYLSR